MRATPAPCRRLGSALAVLIVATSCTPHSGNGKPEVGSKATSVLHTDLDLATGTDNAGFSDAETTTVAIAPNKNPACPSGRVVIASGPRTVRDSAASTTSFPLGSPKPPTTNEPELLEYDGPFQTSSTAPAASVKRVKLLPPTPVDDYDMVTFDNQLVRKANGDLLLVWGVVTKSAPPSVSNTDAYKQWKSFNGGWRGAFLVWRSTDCGETWGSPADPHTPSAPAVVADSTQISVSGTADSAKGECSYPQGNKSAPWFGGYDMEWIYADPVDDKLVYMASSCDSGSATTGPAASSPAAFPGHGLYTTLLFSSTDGGASFSSNPVDVGDSGKNVPVAMTSVPANTRHPGGRLFLFHCIGGKPRLYWSDSHGAKLEGSVDAYYGDSTKPENQCQTIPQASLPGGRFRNAGGVSISRANSDVSADRVRVAYPAVDNGHQVERVALVTIDKHDAPTISPMITIRAEDQTAGHVLYASFIDSDRVDIAKMSDDSTAMLYWMETGTPISNQAGTSTSSLGKVGVFARYRVVRDAQDSSGGTWEDPGDLSVSSGKRRYWIPTSGDFVGDYIKGGFFLGAGIPSLEFVAQWPERSAPTAPLSVHVNVVTVHP